MATALITGASSGIGYEFCHLFAADGTDLVITSAPSDAGSLDSVGDSIRRRYGVTVLASTADLGEPGGAHALWQRVGGDGTVVDYLVNSAGIDAGEPAALGRMLSVNVIAQAELTNACADAMVARGSGAILTVSGFTSRTAARGLAAGFVSAADAFVVSMSKALTRDLRGTGVTSTHLALRSGDAVPVAAARAGYRAMHEGRPRVIRLAMRA